MNRPVAGWSGRFTPPSNSSCMPVLRASWMVNVVPVPRFMSWWRHPAVDAALMRLPSLVDEGTVDVAMLAEEVGISVSRLTHVFRDQIGVPIRSYARWMRLVTAVEHLARGRSITEAAHDAGFADAAHFTRTFRSMFGLSPSEAVGLGTWLHP